MNMQNKQMDDNAKQLGFGFGELETGGGGYPLHSGKCYAE